MDKELNKTIDAKLNEGRSYRNTLKMEIRAAEEGKEDEKVVRGYATTFNQFYELYSYRWGGYTLRYLEEVDKDAFKNCDMADTIMQYNHEGRVFARVSNGTLAMKSDEHGLLIEADLGGTELGRQLYEEIKGGYTNKMSFGISFTITKDSRTEETDEENKIITIKRTILGIGKLYDVSAVSIPANDATEISARSYVEGVIDELEKELLEAQKRDKQKKKIRILMEV